MLRSLLGAAAAATALSLVLAPGPVERHALVRPPSPGSRCTPSGARSPARAACSSAAATSTRYSYSIQPPEGNWAIEIFISGPGFERLAAGAFIDGYDPKTGTGHYKLCRVTTRYGKFKIEAKMSVGQRLRAPHRSGQLPADTFRLRRP